LEDDLGEDGAIFKPYTSEQRASIKRMLDRLMNETYDGDGGLRPTVDLDMSWLDKTVQHWVRTKAKEATLNGSQALDVFRKRSSVSAFRIAALCQYLYMMEIKNEKLKIQNEVIQKRVRQIYLFMAEYILQAMLDRWGKRFEALNDKRETDRKPGPKESLFGLLADTFTREQLNILIEQKGKSTPATVFLSKWKKYRVIEVIDKNTFRKLKKGGEV
jgi:hypothetical protein